VPRPSASIELSGLPLVGFVAIVAGYLWVMHDVDNAVASATAEYDDRLDRIEERLDQLAADDDRADGRTAPYLPPLVTCPPEWTTRCC